MNPKTLSLIQLVVGIVIVIICVTDSLHRGSQAGGEFVTYARLSAFSLVYLLVGLVAGFLLTNGIRGLLRR